MGEGITMMTHVRLLRSLPAVLAIALATWLVPAAVHPVHVDAASIGGLHVQGTTLVNGTGEPVRLLGVNRSGTEYACVQGWGIFDGPADAASISAMASWHVN